MQRCSGSFRLYNSYSRKSEVKISGHLRRKLRTGTLKEISDSRYDKVNYKSLELSRLNRRWVFSDIAKKNE